MKSDGLIQKSDEELMVAYQSGNKEAFQILYGRYSSKVYGFLKSKLKDRMIVDDVFQSTFMKLHQNRSKYDRAFPFVPWLFTVCRNAMLDTFRAQEKRSKNEELNPVAIENAHAEIPVALQNIPDLKILPSNQQKALEMRYIQDFSFEEIANKLNTTSENSRKLVSRALKKLRIALRMNK